MSVMDKITDHAVKASVGIGSMGEETWMIREALDVLKLGHKEKLDRCTIDVQPQFWNKNGEIGFDNLVIFELKRGRSLKSSPMVTLLRKLKIRQRGLSKYCTGRAMLEPELKQNAFKPRLRFIHNEILNNNINGYNKIIGS